MVQYKKYKTKTGKERWKYKGYWGIDAKIGQPIQPQRQGFKSKKEAKLDYERTIFELDKKQGDVQNRKITFNELYLEYLPFYKATGITYSTYRDFKISIENHILPIIGKYRVDMITIKDCQQLVDAVRNKRKNFKKVIRAAKSVMDFGVENNYCPDNPLRKVILKNAKTKYDTKRIDNNVYSPEQLTTFLDFCKNNLAFDRYVFFRLLAFAGLRKSEALALKVTDLNVNEKTLTVQRTITINEQHKEVLIDFTKTQNSSSKKDIVSLDDVTFDLLLQLINVNNIIQLSGARFIFTNPTTRTYYPREAPNRWINMLWKKHERELSELGLHRITPHGLRHSHATLLHALGVNAKDAQHRLRHANIQTTMDIYTHIDQNQKQATAQILNVFEADKVKSKVTF